MFFRSARGIWSSVITFACFSTETDSPVSAASSALSWALSMRRMSAGTRDPASSITISPGTSSNAATLVTFPSRRTVAALAAIFLRASIAFSALYSWTKPIMALIIMIAMITKVSAGSPIIPAIMAAPIRTRIMKSLNWSRSMRKIVFFFFSSSSFLPNSASLL